MAVLTSRKTQPCYAVTIVVWFTLRIRVEGKRVRVDDMPVTDFTEPPDTVREGNLAGWVLSRGAIALQAHGRESRVRFRSNSIRPITTYP